MRSSSSTIAAPTTSCAKRCAPTSGPARSRCWRTRRIEGSRPRPNAGMALHPDRDVILLNSDTLTPRGWIDRLREAAYRSGNIGSVTPLSNRATICSYPQINHDNDLPDEIGWEALDRDLRRGQRRVCGGAPDRGRLLRLSPPGHAARGRAAQRRALEARLRRGKRALHPRRGARLEARDGAEFVRSAPRRGVVRQRRPQGAARNQSRHAAPALPRLLPAGHGVPAHRPRGGVRAERSTGRGSSG